MDDIIEIKSNGVGRSFVGMKDILKSAEDNLEEGLTALRRVRTPEDLKKFIVTLDEFREKIFEHWQEWRNEVSRIESRL